MVRLQILWYLSRNRFLRNYIAMQKIYVVHCAAGRREINSRVFKARLGQSRISKILHFANSKQDLLVVRATGDSGHSGVEFVCCSEINRRKCAGLGLKASVLVKSHGTSPLPPYSVGSVRAKCPPRSNIVWGRGEGGGGGMVAFTIEQTAMMKT